MPYKTGENSEDKDETKAFSMYVFLPHEKNGLPNLFEEIKTDANLLIITSRMTDVTEPIYVSGISQKCFVEMNERGTMGAAVTWSGLIVGGAITSKPRPPPIKFVADHPFMFMIMEDVSGAILFVGTMLDPR
ncbi:serpin-Z1-like [Silene latifolia]|uniref:serpin-Z1-like n=1 Tax=Silene latifolia TaxID=37657 RepID=UPI003D771CFF